MEVLIGRMARAGWMLALLLGIPLSPVRGQAKPPVTFNKVATQVVAGGVSGIVAGTLGSLVGLVAGAAACDENGYCTLGYAAVGAAAGYTLGASYGAYTVGSTPEVQGSFVWTLGGSAAGFVLAVIASGDHGADALLLLGLPPLGAATAFQLSRRWREGPPAGALLDVGGGTVRVSVPPPTAVAAPVPGAAFLTGIRLLRVRL